MVLGHTHMDRHDLHVSYNTYFTLRSMHDYESLCEKIRAIFQYFHPLLVTTYLEKQTPGRRRKRQEAHE